MQKNFFYSTKGLCTKKNYQTTITNWIQQTIGGAYKEVLYLFDDGKIQDWNINLPTKCDLHFSISDYCIETIETRRKYFYKIDWLNDSKFAPFNIWFKEFWEDVHSNFRGGRSGLAGWARRCGRAVAVHRITTCPLRFSEIAPSLISLL